MSSWTLTNGTTYIEIAGDTQTFRISKFAEITMTVAEPVLSFYYAANNPEFTQKLVTGTERKRSLNRRLLDIDFNDVVAPVVASAAALKIVIEGWIAIISGGMVADGDYGDITVTGGGTVMTIDNDAVTLAKIADQADATILGNNTGGVASPVALTATQAKTLLSLNNVEDTALSTWAGSANITTLGTITSGAALQESGESSSTANSGAATNTTAATADRLHAHITLPAGKLLIITGIEWKNGGTVAGNTVCGISLPNANPPSISALVLVGVGQRVANTGANAVQRQSIINCPPIRGGTNISVWVQNDNGTHQYKTATVASGISRKGITFTVAPTTQDIVAWSATTESPYIKIYYREYT